jgi:S-formylglutathione hydrolase
MRFGVYLPPQATAGAPVPVLYWLSGLTCTEENFIIKAGAQRVAAELGLAIITPDTSPRGHGLPGEDDAYDFGSAAGFYVDATQAPWSQHYRMYSYITQELPWLIAANFPVDHGTGRIFGHSMGGHGALVLALRNPGSLQERVGLCADRRAHALSLGRESLQRLPRSESHAWGEYDATA